MSPSAACMQRTMASSACWPGTARCRTTSGSHTATLCSSWNSRPARPSPGTQVANSLRKQWPGERAYCILHTGVCGLPLATATALCTELRHFYIQAVHLLLAHNRTLLKDQHRLGRLHAASRHYLHSFLGPNQCGLLYVQLWR